MRSRWKLGLGALALASAIGVGLGLHAHAGQELQSYELSIKTTALTVDGQKFKVKATGQMQLNVDTGEVSFSVFEKDNPGLELAGEGQMGIGPKRGIAQTSFDAFPVMAGRPGSVYEGTAFFNGVFNKKRTKFVGKFYAIADSFGEPPDGWTFNSGKVVAKLLETK